MGLTNIKMIRDKIKGGVAQGMSIEDISKKHKVPLEDIKKQAKIGVKVEKEHTPDLKIALEIALDHLEEDPKYYSKLKSLGL